MPKTKGTVALPLEKEEIIKDIAWHIKAGRQVLSVDVKY